MKKIPTLFKRVFDENHKKSITDEVTEGCQWILGNWENHDASEIATVKYDGACCAIIDGEIYKRYDAKQKYGKVPPEGAIPCQPEPDPITGHWPHWVKCEEGKPEDKYFIDAFRRSKTHLFSAIRIVQHSRGEADSTGVAYSCEAIGPHWQNNPHELYEDQLILHGMNVIPWKKLSGDDGNVTLESIRQYLSWMPKVSLLGGWRTWPIEGIVFWKGGQPCCKIKRSDFGFEWPIKGDLK